jgi:hypothetical protein
MHFASLSWLYAVQIWNWIRVHHVIVGIVLSFAAIAVLAHRYLSFRHLLAAAFLRIFYILPGIVGFIIAAFGVGVFYMDELQASLKEKKQARWAIFILLLFIGIGAFASDLVQKAQDKAELSGERQQAAKDRNAAADDRQILLKQNSQLIAFGQAQETREDAQKLDRDMLSGFARLEAAVRGKPPSAPPPQVSQPPIVEHTRWTTRRAPSGDPNYPYGLQIIIQSDITIDPVSFAIKCNGEVHSVASFITGQGAYMNVYNGPSDQDKSIAIVHFTLPVLKPETPLVVTITSKDDIQVLAVTRLPQ